MNNHDDPLDVLRGDELPHEPDPAFAADCGRASSRPRDCSNGNHIEHKE